MGHATLRIAFGVLATLVAGCSLSRSVASLGDAGAPMPDSAFDAGEEVDASDPPDASNDVGVPDIGLPDDAGQDAGAPWVIDYRLATFGRSSEASFLQRAPDGAGGFLSWAPPGAARFEDRGDGAGALLLIEGTRTNLVLQSRDPVPGVAWPSPGVGSVVIADDVSPGPDGLVSAHRLTGDGYSRGQRVTPSALPHAASAWGRAFVTTTVWTTNFSYPDQPLAAAWYVASQSATWTRQSDTIPTMASGAYYPIDLTIGPGTLDILLDLHQVEAGRFSSSVIRTGATEVTRDADVLTLTVGGAPARLFVGPGGFAEVSPVLGSAALVAGDELWLLGIAGGNGVRIRHDGAAVVVEAVEGGAVRATSLPLTFVEHQRLGRIEWSPADGRVLVAGVSGPVGTPWSWPLGDVRVGGILGGAGEAFARFGALTGN